MRTIISITLVLFYAFSFGQKFTSDYACLYMLNFKSNNQPAQEQFLMLMNAKEDKSFFISSAKYAYDSVMASDKPLTDPMQLIPYDTKFGEQVFQTNSKYTVFEQVVNTKIQYEETPHLQWEILMETKKIGKTEAQLAKTKAFGRIWYAWFSKDIPINFGPYKFRGLPGFIVEMYDEKKNYQFILQQFKKQKRIYPLPNPKQFKKIPKKDFNATRFKIQTADSGVIIFKDATERKTWFENLDKIYRKYPLLDIQYPIE